MTALVWPKFPEARSNLLIDENIDLDALLSDEKQRKILETHLFVRSLQIMIPKCVNDGGDIEANAPNVSHLLKNESDVSTNDANDFLYILSKNVPIHLLCHKVFIDNYVKKGKVYAMSIRTCIQTMDCVALDPSGLLQFSLLEKTYFRLGIIGQKSMMYRNKNIEPKYLVEIDLKSQLCDKTESKYYQRIFRLLRNSNLKFDLLIKWEPESSEVNPMSILKYFKYMKANPGKEGAYFLDIKDSEKLETFLCSSKTRSFTNSDVLVPKILDFSSEISLEIKEKENEDNEIPSFELLDWIGAQFCKINCDESQVDAEISSLFFKSEHCDTLPVINYYEVSGFFIPKDIKCIISELQSLLNTQEIPFIIMIANGFEDSLVSWKGKNNEHGKRISGENLVGILMKKDKKCHIWSIADEFDFGIEKL